MKRYKEDEMATSQVINITIKSAKSSPNENTEQTNIFKGKKKVLKPKSEMKSNKSEKEEAKKNLERDFEVKCMKIIKRENWEDLESLSVL